MQQAWALERKQASLQSSQARPVTLHPTAGCLRFDFLRVSDQENTFTFYEAYTDADAMAFHKTSIFVPSDWQNLKNG